MKNIIKNKLSYTGTVRLSQYIGQEKVTIAEIHNAGSNSLFNFLSDCLVGNFDVARAERPANIMLLNTEFEDYKASDGTVTKIVKTVKSASNGYIGLLSAQEKIYEENAGKVRYSFMIPRDMIESTTFNSMGLYPSSVSRDDVESYSAICELNIDKNTISPTSVLVVDWELTISNGNS